MGEAAAPEEEEDDIAESGGGGGGDRCLDHGGFNLAQRARYAWEGYQAFLADPGQRCRDCWLLQAHCACTDLPAVRVPSRVVVLMHPAELGRLRASNTAKLLLRVGAELCCWGHEEHDQWLRDLLQEVVAQEGEQGGEAAAAPSAGSGSCSASCSGGQQRQQRRAVASGSAGSSGSGDASACSAVVLFPSADARPAGEIAAEIAAARQSEGGDGSNAPAKLPRCIVVLDGGWKETRKMNQSIDHGIPRCFVSNATRGEYGGTRKYRGNDAANRVQTAAAFIALLKELNDDLARVAQLQADLVSFTEAFERQIRWSGVIFEPRVTLPTASGAASR
mmetsp:Transcript_147129/g.373576  ORF Transcript_147129/g.373576 Transcript_147129/m.373576 type:complete len:334 (+) Transcript_147129:149-1150(+)